MEKEIIIQEMNIEMSFFYEDFELSKVERSEYQAHLSFLAKSFAIFMKDQQKISDKKIMINLNLVGDDYIMELNREYRNKPKITDVLSFPLQENLRAGEFDDFLPEIELGDLFVCHSVCQNQAIEFSLTYIEEFVHLVTHGFLHLCGYDHEVSEEEEKLQEKFEKEILEKYSQLKKGA